MPFQFPPSSLRRGILTPVAPCGPWNCTIPLPPYKQTNKKTYHISRLAFLNIYLLPRPRLFTMVALSSFVKIHGSFYLVFTILFPPFRCIYP